MKKLLEVTRKFFGLPEVLSTKKEHLSPGGEDQCGDEISFATPQKGDDNAL